MIPFPPQFGQDQSEEDKSKEYIVYLTFIAGNNLAEDSEGWMTSSFTPDVYVSD
jgi:hypothetical protein